MRMPKIRLAQIKRKNVRNFPSIIFKKKKTYTVFLSSYTNTSGSLGERAMLWEHEPLAIVSTAFSSSPKFHECLYNSVETRI